MKEYGFKREGKTTYRIQKPMVFAVIVGRGVALPDVRFSYCITVKLYKIR